MTPDQILALAILVTVLAIVAMIVLAAAGYLVFRLRAGAADRGADSDAAEATPGRPYFFERIGLPEADGLADSVPEAAGAR